jgi:hypothetical protein
MRLAVPASLPGAPARAGAVRIRGIPVHSVHRQAGIHRKSSPVLGIKPDKKDERRNRTTVQSPRFGQPPSPVRAGHDPETVKPYLIP